MGNLLAVLDEEIAAAAMVAAAAILLIGFGVVLLVRSVPSKLILLGLLLVVMSILAGGFLPVAGMLPTILLVLAVLIVLAGVFCLVLAFIVQTFKKPAVGQLASGSESPPGQIAEAH